MTANRSECVTVKINSRFAPHYLHVEHADGRVVSIGISSPGRYVDSTVGDLLRAIGEVANSVIADIAKARA